MFQDIQSVKFSELIEQNVDTMSFFSPNGLFLACALQHQLLILDVDAKQVTQKFLSDHPIDYVGYLCIIATIANIEDNSPTWQP
ncbi:hypothetical protein TNCV_3794402 [Trichonephila clavipes]|nr:hypothetical protein TNCV_3794402 [Trichonephila clavipes]